jgi:NAD(P)-dependent dehydrogenase (short-subunit alcohol dehydrogenase family)
MGRLNEKVAVISGAATGIGAATARLFASEGANVVILDINQDGARLADELASLPGRVRFLQCDMADPAGVRESVDAAAAEFGGIDIVFANAGIGTVHVGGTVESIDPERWDRAFDVNARGVYALTGAAIPHMRGRSASIVITTSIYASVGTMGRPTHAYAASKGAVSALTRAMAATYGPEGIRVNAIAPGAIRTQLNDDIASQADVYARVVEAIPLRRMGTPEELAACALFLASDESGFVNGATLVVDGGQTII